MDRKDVLKLMINMLKDLEKHPELFNVYEIIKSYKSLIENGCSDRVFNDIKTVLAIYINEFDIWERYSEK